ncbi:unnamed protein product [Prorocentrum cordatum]|uniref:Uncharacterized protein n=1 Tax=Prorocentrum cordatum TaxID=2364126 RepID=A0ABN9QZZ2_9DINO|nr:unnamed protein product [Polarella glacialis]
MSSHAERRAQRLRSAVVNAVSAKEFERLPGLLKQIAALTPTASLWCATGNGHLEADRRLWGLAGTRCQVMGQLLASKWKSAVKGTQRKRTAEDVMTKPLGGLKALPFLEAVRSIESALPEYVPGGLGETVVHRCAVVLVLHCFRQVLHVEGVDINDLDSLHMGPAEKSMAKHLAESVEAHAKRRRSLRASSSLIGPSSSSATLSSQGAIAPAGGPPAAAADVAVELSSFSSGQSRVRLGELFAAWGADGVGATLTPKQAVEKLGIARAQGGPVQELMQAKAAALRLQANRTWPIFRNPYTAANYVGSVLWTCVHLGLSTEWYTEAVKLTLKGAKMVHVAATGGTKRVSQIMNETVVSQLVKLAHFSGEAEVGIIWLLAWEFLLRVQSEAVGLQAGQAAEADKLPDGRHSAVWVEDGQYLVLRLRRRKNRPQGSVLRRACTCRSSSIVPCVVHAAWRILANKAPGDRLWAGTPAVLLAKMRRLLAQLRVQEAEQYTFKAFRAGRATALAAAGKSVGSILTAGEWRSAAFLAYVDEDIVDKAQLLNAALEESGGEL